MRMLLPVCFGRFCQGLEVEMDKGDISKSSVGAARKLVFSVLGDQKDRASAEKACKVLMLREHPDKHPAGMWSCEDSKRLHGYIFQLVVLTKKVISHDEFSRHVFAQHQKADEESIVAKVKGFFFELKKFLVGLFQAIFARKGASPG